MGKHKEKSKKHEKKHKKKKHRSRKSSSSSSADEWVEKKNDSTSEEEKTKETLQADTSTSSKRDDSDWESLSNVFSQETHLDRRKQRKENKSQKKESERYNPTTHVRELNPYWKDGGDGLPKFKKPSEEDSDYGKKYESVNKVKVASNWRKKAESASHETPQNTQSESQESSGVFSDKELNLLASKLVKAEIMGKTELAKELKEKLENARKQRKNEDVILTQTDSQGRARPLTLSSNYGEPSGSQRKKRKLETHQDGERMRYFADDDKYSLQQMFENEKYNTVADHNREFLKMTNKVKTNDDMDDMFTDNIRKEESDSKKDKRQMDQAVNEHQKIAKGIDRCRFCIQSNAMVKHLMISLGETAFLSLPPHEPLTEGHCLIIPIRHVTCSTLLDENEWADIMNFRKALTRMYSAKNEDVIFFETAKHLNNYAHMYIECIPVDREAGDTAPIYFKKAIDECEKEWAQNKKLVSLKGRDVRRAIPKGLSYFFVSFGMEEGYGHVIEDEQNFPWNFAQEVIGGMLDLHHHKWRKPKQQSFQDQSKRVVEFTKEWSNFDCTKT